jgi:hypothetical protein
MDLKKFSIVCICDMLGLYKLMNLAVDYNQLLFLALLVCLAADICYFMKDYPRAFYFYNQAVPLLIYIENRRKLLKNGQT